VQDGLLSDEAGAFATFGLFLLFGALELIWPCRPHNTPTLQRWSGNVGLYLLGGAIVLVPAVAAFAAALASHVMQIGLLDALALPPILACAVGILALDAVSYANHRLNHNIGVLWRLHAVHHSDPEMDATTTFRHHPIEVMFDSLLVGAAVLLIGISPAQVAVYSLLAMAIQLLAHTNIHTPAWLERGLGTVLVTPGFHQIHHSREVGETNSNYGQVFVFWDHLFGSNSGRAGDRERPIEFGLDHFRDAGSQLPHRLLLQPVLPQQASPHSVDQASGTTRNRSVSPVS
jgi:sterol desaturase/sphingolipid hydroxylase (fatty acid hydroxylase superfamily)